MILCLIKNSKAFTLIELMMAVAFSVLLLTGVYGFYNASSQSYSSGISGQTFQDGANIVISKMIEGQAESGTVYRLSTSSAFYIPNNNSSQLYFCQDNPLIDPCNASDVTVRWYSLDPTSTSLRYYHSTSNPMGYDVIYTAPVDSALKIRFSPAKENNQTLPNVVEIDVALIGRTTSGAASTFVLLRNHS